MTNFYTKKILPSDVVIIKNAIINNIFRKESIASIIWHGGFARGEGGRYDYMNYKIPFGDLDIDVICRRMPSPDEKRKIYEEIFSKIRYQPVTSPIEPTLVEGADKYNILDIKFTPLRVFFNRPTDLSTYDMIHSSLTLYGENLIPCLNVSIEDVSPYSVYRILNNRLLNLLMVFKPEYWERNLTFQESVALLLAATRVYLDMATAVTFMNGVYTSDYVTRKENIIKLEKQDIFKKYPKLVDKIISAFEFKSFPDIRNLTSEEARFTFFQTFQDCWVMLCYLMTKLVGSEIPKNSYLDYIKKAYSDLPKNYYTSYLQTAMPLKTFSPNFATSIRKIAGRIANYYETWNAFGAFHTISKLFYSGISPEIYYFVTLPLICAGIKNDKSVHPNILTSLEKMLRHFNIFGSIKGKEIDVDLWNEMRIQYIAWVQDFRTRKGSVRTFPIKKG